MTIDTSTVNVLLSILLLSAIGMQTWMVKEVYGLKAKLDMLSDQIRQHISDHERS